MKIPASALSVIESAINKALSADTGIMHRLAALHGKVLQIDIVDLKMVLTLIFVDDTVQLSNTFDAEPDATVAGSSLAFMSVMGDMNKLYSSDIEFLGDTQVAKDFKLLLTDFEFDLADQISPFVGGVAAHRLERVHQKVTGLFTSGIRSFEQDLSDFLNIETDTLVSKNKLATFYRDVDDIRDDVDRLAARLDLLGKPQSGDES